MEHPFSTRPATRNGATCYSYADACSSLLTSPSISPSSQSPSPSSSLCIPFQRPLLLVISLCENGSLLELLRQRGRGTGPLSPGNGAEKIDAEIAIEIAQGMQHLSKHHVVHRDLAARNVLVDFMLTCKIADFGLSRSITGESNYYKTESGVFALRWVRGVGVGVLLTFLCTPPIHPLCGGLNAWVCCIRCCTPPHTLSTDVLHLLCAAICCFKHAD